MSEILLPNQLIHLERACFDPGKLSRAANRLQYKDESREGRPFFNPTKTTTRVCTDIPAIVADILEPAGIISATPSRLYHLTSPHVLTDRQPKKLFDHVRHNDPMRFAAFLCLAGELAVKVDGGADYPPERLDLAPGDIMIFRANYDHSFVPINRRTALSIPLTPKPENFIS